MNGVSISDAGLWNPRERIVIEKIVDGLSKTYLVGEKAMDTERYTTGRDLGDLKTQMRSVDNYSARGRKKSEERNSDLAVFIQEITDLPSTLHATLCGCSVGKKEDANT